MYTFVYVLIYTNVCVLVNMHVYVYAFIRCRLDIRHIRYITYEKSAHHAEHFDT